MEKIFAVVEVLEEKKVNWNFIFEGEVDI